MKKHNLLNLIILPLLFVSCVFAQKTITMEELRNMNKKPKAEIKDVKNDVPKTVPAPKRPGMTVELKQAETLAEGSYSKIEKPFIYVARTEEDYAKLKDLFDDFSTGTEVDFSKQAVVAAFAGMKSSGGYSISIYKLQSRANIITNSPPEDAMVTQAITYPYKVAVIDVQEEDSLTVAYSDDFKAEMLSYKVTQSNFDVVGGFIGRETRFKAEGIINVLTFGDLVTFNFELQGIDNAKNFVLNEMASAVKKSSSATISRLEAGNFISKPHPPLVVSVKIIDNKMTMQFEPGKRNYVVNDGFVGRGSLEAIVIEERTEPL